MPDLRYRTGTASVVADASVVDFSSALMLQHAMIGDHISINRLPAVEVTAVNTQVQLGIEPWAGATLSAVPYVLFQDSLLRAARGQLAVDVSKLNVALNASGYFYFVAADQTVPDPSDGDDGQYARQPSTGKEWLKVGGIWVFQGITGSFNFDVSVWSAGTTYAQRVVVPRAGRLWLSLQGNNTGHSPESSPSWWSLFMKGGDAYDVVTFDTDRPASGELVLKLIFTKAVTFYAGLTDSRAQADVGATSTAVYSYRKNGTQFATLTFAAGGQAGPQSGTFAAAADAAFAVGDVLTIIAPALRDATLSGVGATLSGYRN